MAGGSNTQAIRDLTDAIKLMAENADATKEALSSLFDDSLRPAKELSRQLRGISTNLKDSMEDAEDMGAALKALTQGAKELSRIDPMSKMTGKQAQAALQVQIDLADKLIKKNSLTTEASDKLTRQMRLLEIQATKCGHAVGELSPDEIVEMGEAIGKANEEMMEFGKNIKNVDFSGPQAKLTGLGSAIGGVFGGVLGSLKIIDAYGFKNLTTALHKMKHEALDVKKSMESGRGAAMQKMYQKKDTDLTVRERGHLERAELAKRSEKGTLQNMADSYLSSRMKRQVANGGGGFLTKMAAQGGGSITEGMGMSSIMGLTKFMGPLGAAITAIGALLAAFGAVAKRRKDTYEAVGKGGLLAGAVEPKDAYNQLQGQLSRNGRLGSASFESSVMGLNYEKNLSTVKAMVENGIGVGALGKENAFTALTGGKANTMMGGIMRNANYFGHNLGMNPDESVALTVKAITEFNMGFGETEDLFIQINRAVGAAGVSTTKYLGLIDQISGQFGRFNKSMGTTLTLIEAVGKSGKYAADYIGEMAQALLGKDKTEEQSLRAYSQMSQGTRQGIATGFQGVATSTGRELAQAMVGPAPSDPNQKASWDAKVSAKEKELWSKSRAEISDMASAHPDAKGKGLGLLASRFSSERVAASAMQTQASRGGDQGAMGMWAVESNMGKNPITSIAKNMAVVNDIIKNAKGGGIGDLLDTKKSAALQGSLLYGKLGETLGGDTKSMVNALPDALIEVAASWAKKEGLAGGGAAASTNPKFLAELEKGNLTGMLAIEVDKKLREDEEKKARENFKSITDPMAIISNTLKDVLDNLMKLLTSFVDWVNSTLFKDDKKIREAGDKLGAAWGQTGEQGSVDMVERQYSNAVQQNKYDPATLGKLGLLSGEYGTLSKNDRENGENSEASVIRRARIATFMKDMDQLKGAPLDTTMQSRLEYLVKVEERFPTTSGGGDRNKATKTHSAGDEAEAEAEAASTPVSTSTPAPPSEMSPEEITRQSKALIKNETLAQARAYAFKNASDEEKRSKTSMFEYNTKMYYLNVEATGRTSPASANRATGQAGEAAGDQG